MTNIRSVMYNYQCGDPSAANLDSSILPGNAKLTITVEELAQELNVSRTTAYNLARSKDFYPAIRIGQRIVVSVQALIRWLEEQTRIRTEG